MMKRILLILLSVSVASSSAFADNERAIHLSKNQPAPYAGVLLSYEQARTIYLELQDCDRIKLINESFKTSIDLYKKNEVEYKTEISDLKIQNEVLAVAVEKSSSNSFWRNTMYFGLGVVLTGMVSYAARH